MREGCCQVSVVSAVLKALGTLSPVDLARLSRSEEDYRQSNSADSDPGTHVAHVGFRDKAKSLPYRTAYKSLQYHDPLHSSCVFFTAWLCSYTVLRSVSTEGPVEAVEIILTAARIQCHAQFCPYSTRGLCACSILCTGSAYQTQATGFRRYSSRNGLEKSRLMGPV